MFEGLTGSPCVDVNGLLLAGVLSAFKNYLLVFIGFSLVIFFHELGHFVAAKWCNVRVDKFAIGFGKPIWSYRKGLGFRRGSTHELYHRRLEQHVQQNRKREPQLTEKIEPTDAELALAAKELNLGETEYCFNWLPLGGYVKMLGQEDFTIDKSGELKVKEDPRAFSHKPVGTRMIIVSAGVVMNIVCAALVFMLVFMIGTDFPPAVVGSVKMESPAEQAGLRPGDRIVKVNDDPIADFADLTAAIRLSDPEHPLTIVFERRQTEGGSWEQHTIEVQPKHNTERGMLELGVAPPLNNMVTDTRDDPAIEPDEQLKAGDEIIAVRIDRQVEDGSGTREVVEEREVSSLREIIPALIRAEGRHATLTVRRTREDGTTETREVKRRVYRAFRSTGNPRVESGHLLGLVPRRRVALVNPGERADLAGFKPGDIVVRWGNQNAPTIKEILDSIESNAARDIRAEILRRSPAGVEKSVTLVIRPKPRGLFGGGKPAVGMNWHGQEDERVVVADIVTHLTKDVETPAAALEGVLPRGAEITKVTGIVANAEGKKEPKAFEVKTWGDLAASFMELAGQEVELVWRYQGRPGGPATIKVPRTLGTKSVFDLPADHRVTKINGKTSVVIEEDGALVPYDAASWKGAREILRDCVGKTIEVEHRGILDEKPVVEKVTVTQEMLDTWVLRIGYTMDDMVTQFALTKVREANPFKAMTIGIRKTYYFIEQVYLMMQRMIFTRSMGLDQVSGPVGIVKLGSDIAERDIVKLLYFLALISANLAVINFLPLPIVDGGLFIFLIVEKIKGSPIPMKVQVATQLIGLALIIGIFLFVTINDVQKLLF